MNNLKLWHTKKHIQKGNQKEAVFLRPVVVILPTKPGLLAVEM